MSAAPQIRRPKPTRKPTRSQAAHGRPGHNRENSIYFLHSQGAQLGLTTGPSPSSSPKNGSGSLPTESENHESSAFSPHTEVETPREFPSEAENTKDRLSSFFGPDAHIPEEAADLWSPTGSDNLPPPGRANSPEPLSITARPRSNTNAGPQTEKARWLPDSHSMHCMECGDEFTVKSRRHHCRACGKLFCGSCSRFEAFCVGYSDKQRVCIQCHASLAGQQPEPAQRQATAEQAGDSQKMDTADDLGDGGSTQVEPEPKAQTPPSTTSQEGSLASAKCDKSDSQERSLSTMKDAMSNPSPSPPGNWFKPEALPPQQIDLSPRGCDSLAEYHSLQAFVQSSVDKAAEVQLFALTELKDSLEADFGLKTRALEDKLEAQAEQLKACEEEGAARAKEYKSAMESLQREVTRLKEINEKNNTDLTETKKRNTLLTLNLRDLSSRIDEIVLQIRKLNDHSQSQHMYGQSALSSGSSYFRTKIIVMTQFALDTMRLWTVINNTYNNVLYVTECISAPQRWMASVLFPSPEPVKSESRTQWFNNQNGVGAVKDEMVVDRTQNVLDKKLVPPTQGNTDQAFQDAWEEFFNG